MRLTVLHYQVVAVAFSATALLVVTGCSRRHDRDRKEDMMSAEGSKSDAARSDSRSVQQQHDSALLPWTRVSLPEPPPPLAGKSLNDIERYHRLVQVQRWNRGHGGWKGEPTYKDVAQALEVHVDIIEAADQYIQARKKALSELLKQRLQSDHELEANYYHPVIGTALLGSYTVDANMHIAACPKEHDVAQRVDGVARRLIKAIPPWSGGFRVGVVRYVCKELGTDGSLGFGLLWRRGEEKPKRMEECAGTYPIEVPEKTRRWCQDTWTDGEKLTQ
jgi:hypothetical protein